MTLPSQTAPSSLLSPSSYAVVSATAPVVAQHADEITARFYSNMFAAHPELLRVFNQGNQATGEQSKALAGSVVAYAVQLIDPNAPSFAHVMRRIAYKHISLGIRAEQYIVVGHYLLEAVGQVLGEAITPEVAAAWEEVYWLFAVQLIGECEALGQGISQRLVRDALDGLLPEPLSDVLGRRRPKGRRSEPRRISLLIWAAMLPSTTREI